MNGSTDPLAYFRNDWEHAGLLNFAEAVAAFCNKVQLYLVITVIVINIFHLIILSQKSMRANSINILLIGIAISDLTFVIYFIYLQLITVDLSVIKPECIPPQTWFQAFCAFLISYSHDIAQRVSIWLGAIMALIRVLSVRYAMNPFVRKLMKPSKSCLVILSVCLISFLISSVSWARYTVRKSPVDWVPGKTCTMFPANSSIPRYYLGYNGFFTDNELNRKISDISQLINGCFQIIPPILYPFLAGILVFELKIHQKRRKELRGSSDNSDKEKDNTTKVVIWMTVFYFIAGAPFGIGDMLFLIFNDNADIGVILLISSIQAVFLAIMIFHCGINCFICLSLNSQYRNTIKSTFVICDKKKVQPKTATVVSIGMISMTN